MMTIKNKLLIEYDYDDEFSRKIAEQMQKGPQMHTAISEVLEYIRRSLKYEERDESYEQALMDIRSKLIEELEFRCIHLEDYE